MKILHQMASKVDIKEQFKAPVAVLGCGLIGSSWVALFLNHGINVQAWDPDASARKALVDRIKVPMSQLDSMNQEAVMPGVLSIYSEISKALENVFFAQENVPEIISTKKDVFRSFERYADPNALIASSASGLRWSVLSEGMQRPERLLTAHPFNPLHLIPLVEIYCPASEILDFAEILYRKIGRVPVRLKREAVNIVAEDIADVEAVDLALVNGPGLRWALMGAHMTYHLGGGEGGMEGYLSHLGASQEERWADLGTPALTPEVCEALISGTKIQSDGRSQQDLREARDAGLMRILEVRNETQ
jgi:carnitine 3-dehydrogenase